MNEYVKKIPKQRLPHDEFYKSLYNKIKDDDTPRDIYSFTLNPSDKWQNLNVPERLLQCTIELRSALFKILESDYMYEIYPEISTPYQGVNGYAARVHWHGIINMDDLQAVKFYIEKFHRLTKMYSIDIKPITTKKDLEAWHTYYSKNENAMKEYCRRHDTPYEITERLKPTPAMLIYKAPLRKKTLDDYE